MNSEINVGIVADWLVTYAGAEKVIAEFIELFPEAELYSVIDYLSENNRALLKNKKAKTTFIQKLPKAKKLYQKYLPIMPLAIEQLDVSKHNIVLSSSHAVAKGILTGPDQLHISYVHSPIRYAWDLQHQYLNESGLNKGVKSFLIRYMLHKIRMWDCRTANGVDFFIANSEFISRRIKKIYGRNADVIYPPVDTSKFIFKENKDDYFLTASRLTPYKRVDLIVEAFNHMPNKKLVVIGDGPEMKKIRGLAKSNIEILGYQSDERMREYMQNARAFIFAAEEDFGISPVEAMSCGTPVIAYGKGGALETVIPLGNEKASGIFFREQNYRSLISAVNEFENNRYAILPLDCHSNAIRFSKERFRDELDKYIKEKWSLFNSNRR